MHMCTWKSRRRIWTKFWSHKLASWLRAPDPSFSSFLSYIESGCCFEQNNEPACHEELSCWSQRKGRKNANEPMQGTWKEMFALYCQAFNPSSKGVQYFLHRRNRRYPCLRTSGLGLARQQWLLSNTKKNEKWLTIIALIQRRLGIIFWILAFY